MKIMLIDDSHSMRQIQRKLLVAMGLDSFVEANDGLDGISKAKGESPDLILCDWNMPNADGMAFVKEFRKTDKDTPIVMVTTEAEKRKVIESLQAGANGYIIKPFKPDMFKEKISEFIKQIEAKAS